MPESNSNHCLYGYSKTKLPLKVYFRFNMLVHMLLKLIFNHKLVSDLEDPILISEGVKEQDLLREGAWKSW